MAYTESETQSMFVDFLRDYSKQYDVEEMFTRYQIFKDNLVFIEQHNKKHALGEVSFTVGINQLADLSHKEYKMMLGYKKILKELGNIRNPIIIRRVPNLPFPPRSIGELKALSILLKIKGSVALVGLSPPLLQWRRHGISTVVTFFHYLNNYVLIVLMVDKMIVTQEGKCMTVIYK